MFGSSGRPSPPRFYNERPSRDIQVFTAKAEAKIRDAIDPSLLPRVDIMRSMEMNTFVIRIRILKQDWTLQSELQVELGFDEIDKFPDEALMTQLMMLAG